MLSGAALAASLCAANAAGAAGDTLVLFDGRPAAGLRTAVADMEREVPLLGDAVQVPKPATPQVPGSRVGAWTVPGGLTLQWHEAWYAALRLRSDTPLDLRPFVDDGTLELTFEAPRMAHAGLNIVMDCGPGCSRKLNRVAATRAMEGLGVQRLSMALRCFVREGADFGAVRQPLSIESSGSGELLLRQALLRRHGTPNTDCPDYRSQSITPAPLEEVWSMDWWMPRHEQKRALVREMRAAGRSPQVVFIGDSITHAWDDAAQPVWQANYARYDAVALGFGGDRTENVLWRLQHGELDGMQPKVVVLLIGTNNTGDRREDPATTAAGIRRLIDEIQARQPQARVLLLGLFPRDPKPDSPLRHINTRINQIIAGYADGQRVVFLDFGDRLMNADGTLSREIMPDWLHLSERGYRIWAEAMNPTLERMLRQP